MYETLRRWPAIMVEILDSSSRSVERCNESWFYFLEARGPLDENTPGSHHIPWFDLTQKPYSYIKPLLCASLFVVLGKNHGSQYNLYYV